MQFARGFDLDYGVRQLLALAVTALIAAMCLDHAPIGEVGIWVLLRVAVAVVRTALRRTRLQHAATGDERIYQLRTLVLAAASGIVLGGAVLLFFGRLPPSRQLACWLILSLSVALPLHSLALDRRRAQMYIHCLFVMVIGCILYRIYLAPEDLATDLVHGHYEGWFLLLPFLLWISVTYVVRRFQGNARATFEAQYYKQALIESLSEMQRRTEEAVRTKNRFIATAAHDIRQPVVALCLYTDHLKEWPEDRDLVIPKIMRAAEAIGGLFDSLFELSRMDNSQLEPRAVEVELAALMHDLFEQFEPQAKSKGVQLKLRAANHSLITDPVLLRRLIGNLISNAIKFTAPGRKVLIAGRSRGRVAIVEVWDQGAGIAPEETKKIFQEFYKVEGTASAHEGYGLGLSIVARLSHVLKVKLSVRSQLGRGSVFRAVISNVRSI